MPTAAPTKSLSDELRDLARAGQYGHSRTPRSFYMQPSYNAFYWESHGHVRDYGTWQKVSRLSARYHKFLRHMEEVAPQWKEVLGSRILWADNSVEITEVCKHGTHTRQRMLVHPHGDVC